MIDTLREAKKVEEAGFRAKALGGANHPHPRGTGARPPQAVR